MNNNNIILVLAYRIIVTLFICTSITFTVYAKSNQQNIFLDANGNPIPNDVLLSLSGSKPKSKTRKSATNSSKNITLNNKRTPNKKKYQQNPELKKELLTAMQAGNIPRVNQLINAKVKPTYRNYKGETPLGIAVSRGWASMVIKLLENGANINEKGPQGLTLLHTASARGLTDVAKVLVRYGLSPEKKTDKNWTSLHVAARYGHWKVVQFFLQAGVDPDIRNSDGRTALGLARHLRHMGVIKILSRVTRVRSIDARRIKKVRKSNRRNKRSKKRRK